MKLWLMKISTKAEIHKQRHHQSSQATEALKPVYYIEEGHGSRHIQQGFQLTNLEYAWYLSQQRCFY